MRYSYDAHYGGNHFDGDTANLIPAFNVYEEQNQNTLRSKEEYEYQRKREQKMQKKRNQAIDDKWARQNEEQLIKQLEKTNSLIFL